MIFSNDWFSPNIELWNKVLRKFKGKPDLLFLEIGCFEGRATLWLLENILTHPTSKIVVVDTFKDNSKHVEEKKYINLLERFKENLSVYLSSDPKKNKVIIKKGFSHAVLKKEKPELKYDFIYIDASHVAVNVLEDAVLAWRLLKQHGILIFDDYEWNAYSNPLLCPKVSIDAFLKIFKNQFKLRHKGYQVVVEKYNTNTKIKKTERRRTETDLKIRNFLPGFFKKYI